MYTIVNTTEYFTLHKLMNKCCLDNQSNVPLIYRNLQYSCISYVFKHIVKNSRNLDNRILSYDYKQFYKYPEAFTEETVRGTLATGKWNLISVIYLPWFDISVVIHNLELDWDWDRLSGRVSKKELLQYMELPWKWKQLSFNLPIEFIIDNLNLPWDYTVLSHRIPINVIVKHLDKKWSWYILSKITSVNFIVDNPNLPWHRIIITKRCLNEIIMENFDNRWNYDVLSRNLPLEFIVNHLDRRWNWYILTNRFSVRYLYFIYKNPQLPWEYSLTYYSFRCHPHRDVTDYDSFKIAYECGYDFDGEEREKHTHCNREISFFY